jgi:hypothetical protein
MNQESDQSRKTEKEGKHFLGQKSTDRKQTENYLPKPAAGDQKELEDLHTQVN